MSSSSNRGITAATDQARLDPIIGEFIEDLRLKGIAETRIPRFPGPARHFLTWLTCTSTPPETVDGAVIERFLQHDCICWSGAPALGQRYAWRKRRSSPEVMRFVRFLEQTGRVATPATWTTTYASLMHSSRGCVARGTPARQSAAIAATAPISLSGSTCHASDCVTSTAMCSHGSTTERLPVRFPTCSAASCRARTGTLRRMGRKSAGSSDTSSAPVISNPWNRCASRHSLTLSRSSAHGSNAIVESLRAASIATSSTLPRFCPSLAMNPGPMTRRWFGARCSATSNTDHDTMPSA